MSTVHAIGPQGLLLFYNGVINENQTKSVLRKRVTT